MPHCFQLWAQSSEQNKDARGFSSDKVVNLPKVTQLECVGLRLELGFVSMSHRLSL